MKRAVLVLVVAAFAATLAIPALAQTQPNAKIALHVKAHAAKQTNICPGGAASEDPNTAGIACSSYTTEFGLNAGADIYLVVAQADPALGIAGVSCGIQFTADLSMSGWLLCADLEFPNSGPNGAWPNSLGGNRITWDKDVNCQSADEVIGSDGVHAIAGSFYVYAYADADFQVIENQNLQSGAELQVADCNSAATDLALTTTGYVRFSDTNTGCNPCLVECDRIPTESTSWGKIKQAYGN
jgi:hypothetical protein